MTWCSLFRNKKNHIITVKTNSEEIREAVDQHRRWEVSQLKKGTPEYDEFQEYLHQPIPYDNKKSRCVIL